jgi:hypothetical protein
VTGVADAAKTFLLASSAWWGRVQGCGCGCSGRKGPSRPFCRSAFVTLYICCSFWVLLCISRAQTYEQSQERPASRLSQRISPTPTNQLKPASCRPLHTRRLHTSAVCRLHIPFTCSTSLRALRRRFHCPSPASRMFAKSLLAL